VLREVTERPELIDTNAGALVGTNSRNIVEAVNGLLSDPIRYEKMRAVENPFGDGMAAERIVSIIANRVTEIGSGGH
jgi:UDP-N-acetylglucosamine 2-epimerase (non-hydrolysing)